MLKSPFEPGIPSGAKSVPDPASRGTQVDSMPIAELVLDPIDAHAGLDNLTDCIPWLEKVFTRQLEGRAANFPLIVAAANPRGATIFHSAGWADADGCANHILPGKSS